MYLTVKQQLKHLLKADYKVLRKLCHTAKNLVNLNERNLNKNNALVIDLGVNNLVTAVSSKGSSFIIDGKFLKSMNQWFNKENAGLQSIKKRQKFQNRVTNRQRIPADKGKRQVNDYMSKTAKKILYLL